MVHHMLCCFDRDTARPPSGLESFSVQEKAHPPPHIPDDAEVQHSEEVCKSALDRAYSASKPTVRHLALLGHGNGFTFEATPFCSYAARNNVHVLFAGEVSEWPGINAVTEAHDAFIRNDPPLEENDAHWLLDFYDTFANFTKQDVIDTALERLAQVRGSFSFVIYDEVHKRVFAASDADGSQPLFWGCSDEGQLLFGSDPADLDGCNPTATAFPPGTMFASERHTMAFSPGDHGWVISEGDYPGQIMSFLKAGDDQHWRNVKAIPRITSKGALCGAVYKVASKPELHVPPVQSPKGSVQESC